MEYWYNLNNTNNNNNENANEEEIQGITNLLENYYIICHKKLKNSIQIKIIQEKLINKLRRKLTNFEKMLLLYEYGIQLNLSSSQTILKFYSGDKFPLIHLKLYYHKVLTIEKQTH